MACDGSNYYHTFWAIFFFNSTENLNLKKIYEKTSGEHKCTEN